jgi:hypothetical protein
MAGDWIKLESTTPDKPEVDVIARHLAVAREHVVGCLARLWIWADQQSLNGHALSVTETTLDDIARLPRLAEAMRKCGWLTGGNGALTFPHFDYHNGKSAKTRALAQRRKQSERVTRMSRLQRDKKDRKHPERREEGKPSSVVDVPRTSLSHSVAASSARKGAPLPDDWMLPETWRDWALACQPSWTTGHCNLVAAQFRDYWIAQPGQRALKRNWLATWRNWIRREPATGEPKPAQESSTASASPTPPEDDPPY